MLLKVLRISLLKIVFRCKDMAIFRMLQHYNIIFAVAISNVASLQHVNYKYVIIVAIATPIATENAPL